MLTNKLYYGDNLDILRDHDYFPNAFVDLIYLDPPFNSSRNYNVLFKDESGKNAESQIMAFEDTWHWGETAVQTIEELTVGGRASEQVGKTIDALKGIVGTNQVMAYLVMMTARLVELHRVLKPTGSLYLHCDPTASHYLKVILDSIFGVENFRNEIIWERTTAKSHATRRLPSNHDTILCYQKSDQATWNSDAAFIPYDHDNLDQKTSGKYTHRDKDGRLYRLDNLINPNPDRPNLTYEFLGVTKVWRWTKDRMQKAYDDGLVIQTKAGTVPQLKRYLDEQRGRPVGDVWTDIEPLNSQAKERLEYPTQKPLSLLERIILTSSNPGDIVLDPFCGCGTAIAAAQKLGRHWLGIDITHLAIALQKFRLKNMFGLEDRKDYDVIGEPEDVASARQLAIDNRYEFQFWAVSRIRAQPLGGQEGSKKGKKGSDKGIDGVITFLDDTSGKLKRAIVQVKSGKVSSALIRDLRGTIEREQAAMGIFLTLEPPTRDMITEAVNAGFYKPSSGILTENYPRLQIITIEELLHGKTVKMPPIYGMFKQSDKIDTLKVHKFPLFPNDE